MNITGACMPCVIRCHEVHKVWLPNSFAACPPCTSACNSGFTHPFFFKYVTQCMESTYHKRPCMEVPSKFAETHIPESICHVELEGPDGKLCFVMVKHRERRHFFSHGWKRFAARHALVQGDALLFRLITTSGGTRCGFIVNVFKQKAFLMATSYYSNEGSPHVKSNEGRKRAAGALEEGEAHANFSKKAFDDVNANVVVQGSASKIAKCHVEIPNNYGSAGYGGLKNVPQHDSGINGTPYVRRNAAVQATANIAKQFAKNKNKHSDDALFPAVTKVYGTLQNVPEHDSGFNAAPYVRRNAAVQATANIAKHVAKLENKLGEDALLPDVTKAYGGVQNVPQHDSGFSGTPYMRRNAAVQATANIAKHFAKNENKLSEDALLPDVTKACSGLQNVPEHDSSVNGAPYVRRNAALQATANIAKHFAKENELTEDALFPDVTKAYGRLRNVPEHDPGLPYVRRSAALQATANIAKHFIKNENKPTEDALLPDVTKGQMLMTNDCLHAKTLTCGDTTQHPMFMKIMSATNVNRPYRVAVPRSFSRRHMTCKITSMDYGIRISVMQCSLGGLWPVRCMLNSIGMMVLNKGWKDVVRENKLKRGDVCTFELVQPFTFKLHIVPAVACPHHKKLLMPPHSDITNPIIQEAVKAPAPLPLMGRPQGQI